MHRRPRCRASVPSQLGPAGRSCVCARGVCTSSGQWLAVAGRERYWEGRRQLGNGPYSQGEGSGEAVHGGVRAKDENDQALSWGWVKGRRPPKKEEETARPMRDGRAHRWVRVQGLECDRVVRLEMRAGGRESPRRLGCLGASGEPTTPHCQRRPPRLVPGARAVLAPAEVQEVGAAWVGQHA